MVQADPNKTLVPLVGGGGREGSSLGPTDALCGALIEAALSGATSPALLSHLDAPAKAAAEALLLGARCSLLGVYCSWLTRHPSAPPLPIVAFLAAAAAGPAAAAATLALLDLSYYIPDAIANDAQSLSAMLSCLRDPPAGAEQRLSLLQAASRVVAAAPSHAALAELLSPIAQQLAELVGSMEVHAYLSNYLYIYIYIYTYIYLRPYPYGCILFYGYIYK